MRGARQEGRAVLDRVGDRAIHGVIDWAAPWLAPYRAIGEPLAQAWAQGCGAEGHLSHCLNAVLGPRAQAQPGAYTLGSGQRLCFVSQNELPEGEAYEAFIYRTGSVPTRENLHDFFNALVWLHWPGLKSRLNALQAREIGTQGVGRVRGAARDALTLLDENGALFAGSPALWRDLQARRWKSAFVTHRALWADACVVVVGHALMEKLTQPRKPMCAHLWRHEGDGDAADLHASHTGFVSGAGVEAAVEAGMQAGIGRGLADEALCSKPLAVLPVLGVPNWWPANEAPSFYDDTAVFRPPQALNGAGPMSWPT